MDNDNSNDNSGSNNSNYDIFQLHEYLEFDQLVQYNYHQSSQQEQQQEQQQLSSSQHAYDFRNHASEATTDLNFANGKSF